MSAAELFPAIQSLPRGEKEQLFHFLAETLSREEHDLPPLPEGFPPPEDGCGATREELERSRRQIGIYTLKEIWQSLDQN